MSEEQTLQIRMHVKCCACRKSMMNSEHINFVLLDKKARWKFPVGGNIFTGESDKAISILCDDCIEAGRKPTYAVEWNNELTQIKYHSVKKLEVVK